MDNARKILDIGTKYARWGREDELPLYISGAYKFNKAALSDCEYIVITPVNEQPTLPALKKHIAQIRKIENLPVAFESENISAFRRKNMIESGVPFISDKQVYLPFIGTFLQRENESKNGNIDKPLKFMPSTQELLLRYLYAEKQKAHISDMAKGLPFTAMTLTRASKQLEATGLFNITKDGVKKVIEAKYGKKELYKRTKQYMTSPVKYKGYIDKGEITSDMMKSGISALSERTALNTTKIQTYALNARGFDKGKLQNELLDTDNQAELELWIYDPHLFGRAGIVDEVSLALSFADACDERIEKAVEFMIDNIWRN